MCQYWKRFYKSMGQKVPQERTWLVWPHRAIKCPSGGNFGKSKFSLFRHFQTLMFLYWTCTQMNVHFLQEKKKLFFFFFAVRHILINMNFCQLLLLLEKKLFLCLYKIQSLEVMCKVCNSRKKGPKLNFSSELNAIKYTTILLISPFYVGQSSSNILISCHLYT